MEFLRWKLFNVLKAAKHEMAADQFLLIRVLVTLYLPYRPFSSTPVPFILRTEKLF